MLEKVSQVKKELDLRSDAYIKGITDYLIWTITITIVAMLWIADNLDGLVLCSKIIAVIALLCLIISVIIAICITARINIALAKDWSLAVADSVVLQNQIMKTTLMKILPDAEELEKSFERKEREADKQKWEALKSSEPFSKPEGYRVWITSYTVFLIAGVIFYVLAQVLNAFC